MLDAHLGASATEGESYALVVDCWEAVPRFDVCGAHVFNYLEPAVS